MAKLLSDSDSDIDVKINEEFAQNYDKWRAKEELQTLKDRYGDEDDDEVDDSTSQESEDEEEVQVTPEFEKAFLKTLSLLKSRDPKIYDKNVTFFEGTTQQQTADSSKKTPKQSKPMYLKDYERKVILEKQGVFSDEEEEGGSAQENQRSYSPTYLEEQHSLKESFRTALEDSDDDADDLLKERHKSQEEREAEEQEYLLWLKGAKDELTKDKDLESDLKPLHDYWNDPRLDTSETFLRDYILNKHVAKDGSQETIPSYDEVMHDAEQLSEDEATLEKQAEFEHKYNFRFEEPDLEFIKRFPRTIKESLRKKNDARKLKREELRKRKQEEKAHKEEELKRLKALKRKEIMEKIAHLKEITGNSKIGFDTLDLSCDFDPEKYDEQMRKLFDEQYYAQEEGEQKPIFPNDDEIDGDWDEDENSQGDEPYEQEWHSGDQEDTSLEPPAPDQDVTSQGRTKKKTKFARVLARHRDTLRKEKKSLIDAFDEYYRLDYCDVVGDTPIRFRYRNVEPNDFGLTTEEILYAKDKELNQWCSLKKTCQYRTREEEMYDIKAFKRKAQNEALKRKVFASLYQDPEEDGSEAPARKKARRKRKKKVLNDSEVTVNESSSPASRTPEESMSGDGQKLDGGLCTSGSVSAQGNLDVSSGDTDQHQGKKKKKKKKGTLKKQKGFMSRNNLNVSVSKVEVNGLTASADRLKAFGVNPKKVRNKILYGKKS